MLHQKPTQNELDQQIKDSMAKIEADKAKTQEALDKANSPKTDENSSKQVETEQEQVKTESKQEADDADKTKENVNKATEDTKTKELETSEDNETETLKKRYSSSSREAEILYNKTKKLTEAIEKASQDVEVTDDDLKKEYPEWEMMTEVEQKLAKKNMVSDKQMASLKEATREFKDIDAWNRKVDEFVADPQTLSKHSELEGKEEEFKNFATKNSHRGADFDLLINSFLYEQGKKQIKHKGSMMPTGSAGADKSKPKDEKLSADESRRIRSVDYKKYLALLKAGKISDGI